jgi:hypothetical protein
MGILKLFMVGLPSVLIASCTSGWSIAGYELTPSDTMNTVFIEIIDTDSTVHWYHGRVNETSNWCYMHDEWEDVRVK